MKNVGNDDREELILHDEKVAPVFEGYVHPNTVAGEIQGYANIAGAFYDQRDPARRRYARIMWAILAPPTFVFFAVLYPVAVAVLVLRAI